MILTRRFSFLLLLPFLAVFTLPGLAQDLEPAWQPLFDGKTMDGWESIQYPGGEDSYVTNNVLVIPNGLELSGVVYNGKKPIPTLNYEVRFETKRVNGSDFFGGLTFPVGTNHCTLVVGGWGGGLIGISSIDNLDASENETTEYEAFKNDVWHKIHLKVGGEKEVERFTLWLDGKEKFEVDVKGRQLAMRTGDIEMSMPFGLSTFMSTAYIRNIEIRSFSKPGAAAPAAVEDKPAAKEKKKKLTKEEKAERRAKRKAAKAAKKKAKDKQADK